MASGRQTQGRRWSKSREWSRSSRGVIAGALAAATVMAMAPAAHADAGDDGPKSRVIVSGAGAAQADSHVKGTHGKVVAQVDAAGAVVADVTPTQAAALKADPTVTVTPNVEVHLNDVTPLPGARSPSAVFAQSTGATTLVNNGVNGAGVTVAVLDTGIDRLPDFNGRLAGGVDLSGEGDPFHDSYGHGTFVSGLIAGNGASSAGAVVGEAPGAQLASIKVAGASGVTDLATVIQGVQWAIDNHSTLGIGVLNLSLGAIPTQSSTRNPLDQAVESAWRAGITVVASAGNAGPSNGTVLSPGDDPLVVTVGALDDKGSPTAQGATIPTFSSIGPTPVDGWFKPDLVAPGRSVISLRAPGSAIDRANPGAVIGTANFVGSGTSFSTAITSGAAALVLQANRRSGPDDVKGRLLATASPGPVGNPFVDGHGSLNVAAAATVDKVHFRQQVPQSSAAPGSDVSLATTWAGSSWDPQSWKGTKIKGPKHGDDGGATDNSSDGGGDKGAATGTPALNGSGWNGSGWNGSGWNGATWNGSGWNGSGWNGSGWNGSGWNGSGWNGSGWNGSGWNGSGWN